MIKKIIFSLLFLTTINYGCKNDFKTVSGNNQPNTLNLTEVGKKITVDIGFVDEEFKGSSNKKFVIFEENHASIKGQVQIAMMLNRLYHDFAIKNIGLEGALYSEKKIEPDWSFNDVLEKEKVSVGVQLIKEGEINCAEFLSLVNPDIHVFGIEDEKEYNIKSPENEASLGMYLISIAREKLTFAKTVELKEIISVKKDTAAAYEYLLNSNTFTKKYYDKFKNRDYSIEDRIGDIKDIMDEASEVNADISRSMKRNMKSRLNFLKTASKRSDTMIDNAIAKTEKLGNSIALIIGAGHTDRMVELLKKKNHSYIVITPNALEDKQDTGILALYKMKMRGLSVDNGVLGEILNNKKPPVTLNTSWLKTKANLYAITRIVARELSDINITIPDELPTEKLEELKKLELPNLKINYSSFSITEDDEIIFEIKVKSSNTTSFQSVWVKTQQVISKVDNLTVNEIEYKLNEALKELEGGGEPPIGPTDTHKVKDPNLKPRKSNAKVKVIGNDTFAFFAKSKSDVLEMNLTI